MSCCISRLYCIGHGVLPVFTSGSGDGTSQAAGAALLLTRAAGKDPLPAPSVVPSGIPSGAGLGGLLGMATVPPKLVSRILSKEYIPMYEMLPECWRLEANSGGACCQSKRPRHALVLDINIWTECYSVMAAILASAYPGKAPHLFSYLRTIVRASRTFESTAWVAYDVAYRRQAANQSTLDWGVLDSGLYNDAFTGRAKAIPRCSYCLADTHHPRDCPDAPGGKYRDAGASGEAKPTRSGLRPSSGSVATASVKICRLYNSPGGNRCKYPNCRYAHLCQACHAPHPATECGDKRRAPYNRLSMPPRPGDSRLPHPGAEAWPPR